MNKRKIWGLDLGLTSVGWGVVNAVFDKNDKQINKQGDKGDIVDCGVRIFTAPEVSKTGESPAKARREARGSRRCIRRRARRMQAIRSLLCKEGLLSDFGKENWLHQYHCPPNKKRDKGPWEWRLEGLSVKLEPEEWAKTLIHLAKRRGFKSNRKGEGASDKEAGKINKSIQENESLKEKYTTVGEMVMKDPKYKGRKRNTTGNNKNKDEKISKEEKDNRAYKGMVTRAMLLDEINILFNSQKGYGNQYTGDDFKDKYVNIWGSQIPFDEGMDIEEMVGMCPFEQGEKRAPRQSYNYERYTLLQKINQTQIWWQGEKCLLGTSPQELREAVIALAYEKKEPTYADLRKALGMGFHDRFVIRYKSEMRRVREAIKTLRAFPNDKDKTKTKPITLFQNEEHINEVMKHLMLKDNISYGEIRKIADLPQSARFPKIAPEDENEKFPPGLKLERYQKIKQKIGDGEWKKFSEGLSNEELENRVSAIEEICTYAKDKDKDKDEKLEELNKLKAKGFALSEGVLVTLSKIQFKDASSKTKFNNEGEIFFEIKGWHLMRAAVKGEQAQGIWKKLEDDARNKKEGKTYLDIIAEAGLYHKTDEGIKKYLEKHKVLESFDDSSEQTILLDAVSRMNIKEAGGVSIKACQKINPYLAQGLLYDKACEKADYKHHAPSVSSGALNKKTKKIPGGKDWAELMKNIRNPRVVRAISQARKIVNALVEKHGTPHGIHIELSRDLANSFDERKKIKEGQEQFRNDKNAAFAWFKENVGKEAEGDELLKARLYIEQSGFCPYTGEPMNPSYLGDPSYFEIDHILPLSRSMDDSQTNKVLTFTRVNREKGSMIPHEWLAVKYGADTDNFKEKWEKLKAQTKHFRIGRREKIIRKTFSPEEAKEHQRKWVESPTSKWITTAFKDILKKHLQLGEDSKNHLQTRNGALTAFLRAHWGLAKNRETHQHHALDAVVLALSTQSMVQQVSKWSQDKEIWSNDGKGVVIVDEQTGEKQSTKFKEKHKSPFPQPWETFRQDLLAKIGGVFISSPPRCRMSHEAHAAIIYKSKANDSSEKPLGLVRGGKPASWSILRTDIYQYKGKYYHVCVRPYHRVKGKLPTKTTVVSKGKEKSEIMLSDEHFVCSLYPGDAVLIRKKTDAKLESRFEPKKNFAGVRWGKDEDGKIKSAIIVGYFLSTHDIKGQIYIKAHDNSWGKVANFHPGIQGLLEIQKLHIPLLGGVSMDDFMKGKYQVKEKLPKLNKPPHRPSPKKTNELAKSGNC